ncbi:MAG: hypothetical protein NC543_04005 [bacterium]|nr:hypothetical protein [bacterium]MCM1373776.1 hypothetical protein [Muribaculum sp.]
MDLAMVILTALAVIVSVIALCVSYNAAQKGNSLAATANELTKTANQMQMGQVEMQIRELIQNARSRYEDIAIQLNGHESDETYGKVITSALEGVLNAYDEACAKYLDDKVDKERFKKLYHDEIRQLVTDEATKEKYREPQTKFHATNKVYTEWNNLEK